MFQHTAARRRLGKSSRCLCCQTSFNTQPPEGGWRMMPCIYIPYSDVSTHSRPKAAGGYFFACADTGDGFNTQPPEGGWNFHFRGTNSVTKFQHTAARRRLVANVDVGNGFPVCFNTQPPEGGWTICTSCRDRAKTFQHTAARRRLARQQGQRYARQSFNTQPPEGGWKAYLL